MQINSIQVAYPRGPIGHTGEDGKSAYDLAVEHGFVGTEQAWIASLKGSDGADGATGPKGEDGEDGKSAYEIAVEQGFAGALPAWLASLRGADGAPGADGKDGKDGADGLPGPKGEDGKDGAQGADGADGAAGKGAYELAVERGFVGTEQDWLNSLKNFAFDVDYTPEQTGEAMLDVELKADARSYIELPITEDLYIRLKGPVGQSAETYLLLSARGLQGAAYYNAYFGLEDDPSLSILGPDSIVVRRNECVEVCVIKHGTKYIITASEFIV